MRGRGTLAARIMEIVRTQRPYEPYEFAALAAYNTRRSQGIVHTDAFVEMMRQEQERFDRAMLEKYGCDDLSAHFPVEIGSHNGSRKP